MPAHKLISKPSWRAVKRIVKPEERYAPVDDHISEITERVMQQHMRLLAERVHEDSLEVFIHPSDAGVLDANARLRLPAYYDETVPPTILGIPVTVSDAVPFGMPVIRRRGG